MSELEQKAIQQAADEYSYNEWRDYPENQAIANKGFIAGVAFMLPFYKKQKEINKELVEENENLKKDKAYFSDNLDKEIAAKLEMQKQINELKREIEERKRYEEKLLRESFRAPQDEPPSDAEDDYPADYYDGDEYSEGL